jgi:hypothetical protein
MRDCRRHCGRRISFDLGGIGVQCFQVPLRCNVHSAGAQPFADRFRTAIKAPACAALT